MMPRSRSPRALLAGVLLAGPLFAMSCVEEARPWFLGGTWGLSSSNGNVFVSLDGTTFTEQLISERTFMKGRVVRTTTHRVRDMARTPIAVDFNGDGRMDPVVGYAQQDFGVVQILLSHGDPNTVQYASLTLDGGENQWRELSDVEVADMDNDGSPDLLIGAADGIAYLHHPSNPDNTHVMSEWGQPNGALELIAGTNESLSGAEISSIIATVLAESGADPNSYTPTVKQGYTSIEVGDFDNDGNNDIAGARSMEITLKPKPTIELPEIYITGGSIQVLVSPGATTTGEYFTGIVVGQHERHALLDREGASDLVACDVDGDGDLDLISAASRDTNVQIAWFENPGNGGALDPTMAWPQRRIGSIQGPIALAVADLTGDTRLDVVAASADQRQVMLFVQPEEGPARGYDWFTAPIATFETYDPRAMLVLDVDNDQQPELVLGGTAGALRYFEAPLLPGGLWEGHVILNFDPPGDVGLLGYGDLDGDGDVDLVGVVSSESDPASNYVSWVRNNLLP